MATSQSTIDFLLDQLQALHGVRARKRAGARIPLAPGTELSFGGATARVIGLERWTSFSYSRSPGISGVLAGFLAILVGSLLLALPAAVARLGGPEEDVAARVFASRGMEALASEWNRFGDDH